jgi:hypothetical protein
MEIGLVSCVKSKRNYPVEAQKMYISPLFVYAWKYAKQQYDMCYILSAKYGLLAPDTIIEPYEMTLNNFTKQQAKDWSDMVYKQIKDNIGLEHVFYFHAGQNYREYLIDRLNAVIPLEGMALGMQLQWYKKQRSDHGLFS